MKKKSITIIILTTALITSCGTTTTTPKIENKQDTISTEAIVENEPVTEIEATTSTEPEQSIDTEVAQVTEQSVDSSETNEAHESTSLSNKKVDVSKLEKLPSGNYQDEQGNVYDKDGNMISKNGINYTEQGAEQAKRIGNRADDRDAIYGNYDNYVAEGYKNGALDVVDYWIYKDSKGRYYAYDPVNKQKLYPGDTDAWGEVYYGYTLDEISGALDDEVQEDWGSDRVKLN